MLRRTVLGLKGDICPDAEDSHEYGSTGSREPPLFSKALSEMRGTCAQGRQCSKLPLLELVIQSGKLGHIHPELVSGLRTRSTV